MEVFPVTKKVLSPKVEVLDDAEINFQPIITSSPLDEQHSNSWSQSSNSWGQNSDMEGYMLRMDAPSDFEMKSFSEVQIEGMPPFEESSRSWIAPIYSPGG